MPARLFATAHRCVHHAIGRIAAMGLGLLVGVSPTAEKDQRTQYARCSGRYSARLPLTVVDSFCCAFGPI